MYQANVDVTGIKASDKLRCQISEKMHFSELNVQGNSDVEF